MSVYTIIRVYEVPGKNQIDATNAMMEAMELRVEKGYHTRDYIRPVEGKPGTGKPVDLTPPKGFMAALLAQLTGRA